MKVELRKISYNARLSHETNAYFAEVWVDGKKRGTTENDGHGGPDNIRPRELEAEINEYAKTLPPIMGYEAPLAMDAELLFGELLAAHIARKTLKQLMAKKIVFVQDGKLWTARGREGLGRTVLGTGGVIVLNDQPFDDALKLYLAHAEA